MGDAAGAAVSCDEGFEGVDGASSGGGVFESAAGDVARE